MLFDAPPSPAPSYRVLARAYRPHSFADLIGQELLVQSLTQALSQGRLPHGFIFTGIRGVGKTTTARILARCLNCDQGPTTTPCGVCPSCLAISEDRHLDVIEIDAASRTGVEDMRELIEAGRYKAVMGRYKIFIIDEVHMLSKSAFNALLKTLEEPPPHLIFILATTEIEKVPATILSRCMRCGLKRIDMPTLCAHFQKVAQQEGTLLDFQAAELLARAAEGSVRDGLSLLDQAITLSPEKILPETLISMLGLVDKAAILDLLESLVSHNTPQTLKLLRQYYHLGADCHTLTEDLLESIYLVVMKKLGQNPEDLPSYALSAAPRLERLGKALELSHLMTAWQHLILTLSEVEEAPKPLLALEMALLRLMASLPGAQGSLPAGADPLPPGPEAGPTILATGITPHKEHALTPPAEAAPKALEKEGKASGEAPYPVSATNTPGQSAQEIVHLLTTHKEPLMAQSVRRDVRPVRLEGTSWTIQLTPGTPSNFPQQLSQLLQKITGEPWHIHVVNQGGGPTLEEQEAGEKDRTIQALLTDPLTQAAIDAFPKAVVKVESITHL